MVILDAARRGRGATDIRVDNCAYTIDAVNMLQVNKSTGRERPIRATTQYQWQNARGRWFAFGAEANAKIVHAQYSGYDSVTITVSDLAYTIDLGLMEQRNNLSGRVRPIRLTFNTEGHALEAVCKSAPSRAVEGSSMEYMLKITYLGDTRRVKVEWPRGSVSEGILACIWNAVSGCFGAMPENIIYQYVDADGDACTLVASTVEDFLSFACNGVLRLLVSGGTSHPHASMEVLSRPTDSFNCCISTPPTTPFAAQRHDAEELSIEDQYELIEWS